MPDMPSKSGTFDGNQSDSDWPGVQRRS